MFEEFGVTVSSIDIAAIDIDKTSQGYKELKAVTKDLATANLQAQTEVGIKEMRDSQKLGILERAGRAFVDIKEGAYARHKQTQSQNFDAYQTEAQEHVGVAGAEGLGKMKAGGGGMNPGGMMAGMAVGGAIGQNIAGAMSGVMQKVESTKQSTPPPIPQEQYHVAINGKAEGPYTIDQISILIKEGKVDVNTLVWKKGMADWIKAGDDSVVANLLEQVAEQTPPPLPNL